MTTSVLNEKYHALGANFRETGQWLLPGTFTTTEQEYAKATKAVAIIERPFCGWLRISGADHVDLLHRITSNELRNLKPGDGQVTVLPNEVGRIIDRVFLLKAEGEIKLLTSADNSKSVMDWIQKYLFVEDVEIKDLSREVTTLSLSGPNTVDLLDASFSTDIGKINKWGYTTVAFHDSEVMIHRTDELMHPFYNLVVEQSKANLLWDSLFEYGADFGLAPIGEDTYEILRIESGWPVLGKDFDDRVNPHEAGMFEFINFDKGCYIGQEVIARLDTYDKVQKHLKGILLQGNTLPGAASPVTISEQEIGYVTSATHSIKLDQNIALAYIRTKFFKTDSVVVVHSGSEALTGRLSEIPF